eukprot:5536286-Pyramimonas_sp.AAC.1
MLCYYFWSPEEARGRCPVRAAPTPVHHRHPPPPLRRRPTREARVPRRSAENFTTPLRTGGPR